MSSSGMWRCVDLVSTEVSEVRIASIFNVEKSAKMEAIIFSETSVDTRSTQCHIPEDDIHILCSFPKKRPNVNH
jgi:hypothetical protein